QTPASEDRFTASSASARNVQSDAAALFALTPMANGMVSYAVVKTWTSPTIFPAPDAFTEMVHFCPGWSVLPRQSELGTIEQSWNGDDVISVIVVGFCTVSSIVRTSDTEA